MTAAITLAHRHRHSAYSQECPLKNTLSTYVTPRRIRRRLTSALLALVLIGGILATTATPANAASLVKGCFRSNLAGMNVVGIPVQLQAFYQGRWYTIATTNLGVNGCVAWSIPPSHRGYWLQMVVNHRVNPAYWVGSSPLWALPGDGIAELGTGVVTCYGCGY